MRNTIDYLLNKGTATLTFEKGARLPENEYEIYGAFWDCSHTFWHYSSEVHEHETLGQYSDKEEALSDLAKHRTQMRIVSSAKSGEVTVEVEVYEVNEFTADEDSYIDLTDIFIFDGKDIADVF